jgi:16S rRNA processing protein RimM
MSQDDRLVLVAKVAGAFGVRGEIRLTTFTDAALAVVNYRDLLRRA